MTENTDLFLEYARYAYRQDLKLRDPETKKKFADEVTERLSEALSQDQLVYGLRTEYMFEAMALSLGRFQLFKHEDNGHTSGECVATPPDFRMVLESGEQWLVEVKNCRVSEPRNARFTLNARTLQKYQNYAKVVGVPLLLAIYWSKLNFWTLINPNEFLTEAGGVDVKFLDSMPKNLMSKIGDKLISLPECLSVEAQLRKPDIEGDVEAMRTFRLGQTVLQDELDQKMAGIFMSFGDSELEQNSKQVPDDRSVSIKVSCKFPGGPTQGLYCYGFLSSMYSRYFQNETKSGSDVTALFADSRPDWFQPLIEWNFGSSQLKMRIFSMVADEMNE